MRLIATNMYILTSAFVCTSELYLEKHFLIQMIVSLSVKKLSVTSETQTIHTVNSLNGLQSLLRKVC